MSWAQIPRDSPFVWQFRIYTIGPNISSIGIIWAELSMRWWYMQIMLVATCRYKQVYYIHEIVPRCTLHIVCTRYPVVLCALIPCTTSLCSTPCLCSFSFSESVGVWLASVWMQCKNLQEALEKSSEGHAVWTRVHPLLSFNSSARLSTSVCHCFHPKVATVAFIHKVKSSYKWHFENPVANRVCMKVVNSTEPWAGHSIIEAHCVQVSVWASLLWGTSTPQIASVHKY